MRKVVTKLDSVLKSKDITLPTKAHVVITMVFPVLMYGCESWTTKKAERQRIDILKLWCWRRLLRIPWTARKSNQSILKEISPEHSLEGLMLELQLQYFGHLMGRVNLLEKTQMRWKIEGRKRWGRQRMRWLGGITDSMDMSLRKVREMDWRAAVHGVSKSRTQRSDWTTAAICALVLPAPSSRLALHTPCTWVIATHHQSASVKWGESTWVHRRVAVRAE